MLILERRTDEQIMIGDDVVLTIVRVRGDRVWIACSAPIEIPVHREEIQEKIAKEGVRSRARGAGRER